jgi:hypothetical protein
VIVIYDFTDEPSRFGSTLQMFLNVQNFFWETLGEIHWMYPNLLYNPCCGVPDTRSEIHWMYPNLLYNPCCAAVSEVHGTRFLKQRMLRTWPLMVPVYFVWLSNLIQVYGCMLVSIS